MPRTGPRRHRQGAIVSKPMEFTSVSAAFAYCRAVDKPVLVKIKRTVGETISQTIGTVYPSGNYRPTKAVPHE